MGGVTGRIAIGVWAAVGPVVLATVMAAVTGAAPARADGLTDTFVNSLNSAGLGTPDPAAAAALGRSICPMLAQPGQTAADAAAKVADSVGMPLGPATVFTGLAISVFCPGAVAAIGSGQSPVPLGLLGL